MGAPSQELVPGLEAWRALSQGPDAVLLLDKHGIVRRLNRPIGGIAPAQLQGHKLDDHIQEGALPRPGESTHVRIGHESGRWWRLAGHPAGEALLLVCMDVDAQHRELGHLRAAERLMRDSEGMSHIGIWTWDITQPHAEWTPELYRIYGLDPEHHTPTYDDYLTRVHPDDVERVKAATEACFQDHAPYSHDERIRHSDGQWRYLHTWARPVLDDEGQLTALHGVCMDITDRKHAEEALRASEARLGAIVAHAGLGIATLDEHGHPHNANDMFDHMIDHIAGTAIWQGMDMEAADRARKAVRAVLQDGEPHVETFRIQDAWIRLVLTRVDQDPPFVVAVAQDVSAEKAAKEARDRIDELQAQHTEHVQMVGAVSHEMKNPLTPVQIQLNLLSSGRLGELDEQQLTAIQRVQSQVDRLGNMLHELLDAARAGSGSLPLHIGHCDLAAVLADCVATHRPAAEEVDVHLHASIDPMEVDADGARIAQAVDNLIANAIRFTPSGGHVDVRAGIEGGAVIIEVADDGVGIPPDQQKRLFQAFSRGDQPALHPGKSTGLGLYIVQGIIAGHGGTVDVSSDGGTTFTIRFPARAK